MQRQRHHHQNLIDAIKGNYESLVPAETAHRSCTACLLSWIGMKLGRKLEWDWKKEQFVNDAEANAMLEREERAPYGAKCASASGKIQIFGNGSATIAFGENVSINLKDADSLIYVNNAKWDTCNFKSGAVNLGGKTLTIQANKQIQMGLAFSNGGAVVLKGTALYVEWNGMCPSFSGTGVFQGDSPMNIKKKIDAPGWTLKTSHQLYGNVNAMPTKTEFPGWEGPVEFSWNSVQVANYAGASAGTSNTVFNLKGAVSGSGTLRIGESGSGTARRASRTPLRSRSPTRRGLRSWIRRSVPSARTSSSTRRLAKYSRSPAAELIPVRRSAGSRRPERAFSSSARLPPLRKAVSSPARSR